MRNIGVIFILVLIGMLIWKASEQERPALPARAASAAEITQESSRDPVPISSNQHLTVLPAEKIREMNSSQLVSPSEPPEEDADTEAESLDQTPKIEQEPAVEERKFERIVIPSIKVNAKIVRKPYDELTWDLTNLGQDVAALEDVPTQTTDHNLVFAGHVTVRNGSHGPFRYLFRLIPGDIVILQDEKYTYTYRVREQILVYPEESSVLNDTPHLQLTLITCTTYDEETATYLRRRIIFADLEKVEAREVLLD